jgi:hypothetical protein
MVMVDVVRSDGEGRSSGFASARGSWDRGTVLQHEPVQQILGMFRTVDGVLSLTATSVVFEGRGDDATVVELADVAWVEVAHRSKRVVIEITTRSARVLRFAVGSPDWASRIRRLRDRVLETPAGVVHDQPMTPAVG